MKSPIIAALISLSVTFLGGLATAQDLGAIVLPSPQTHGGKPLMEALSLRSTSRAFASDPLPLQTLSDLLWAAWGINTTGQRFSYGPFCCKAEY